MQEASRQDFEAVVKLASVTELLIGEGQQTPGQYRLFHLFLCLTVSHSPASCIQVEESG